MSSFFMRNISVLIAPKSVLALTLGVGLLGCASDPDPQPEGEIAWDAVADRQQNAQQNAPQQGGDAEGQVPADEPAGGGQQQALGPPPEGDGGGGADGGGAMGDFARERGLEEQEKKALAENYFNAGRELFHGMRYQEAAAQLTRAARLDPGHIEARNMLDRALWIIGDRQAEYRQTTRYLVEERQARIQQAQIEVERLYTEGELLMSRQRYEEAQERYSRVLEAIRWFPYNIARSGLREQAEQRIAEARQLSEEQERRRRQMLQEAARQAAEHERSKTRLFVQATIRALYEDADDAFRASNWDKCERLCDDILRRQPDHVEAARLLDDAIEARHRDRVQQTYRDRVEHWRRQLEWVETSAIPYQQLFQFPNREEWERIASRDLPIAELLSRQDGETEQTIQIRNRLDSQTITLNFVETPFEDAIDFLRQLSGLNYVLTAEAQDVAEDVTVSLRLRDISLRNALNLTLASDDSLSWRIENGVVLIATDTDEFEELILEFYDVTEIVQTPPDFPAPELGLSIGDSGGGGGGGGGVLSFDDGGDEETTGGFDADALVDLIENRLGDDVLHPDGSVEYSGGILIVRQSLAAHERILQLLDALRRTVGVMVTVEARFLQLQDNVLEHIGIDILNQPGAPPTAPPDTFGQINQPRGTNGGPGNVQVGYNYTDAQGQTNVRAGIANALSSLAPASLPFNITPSGGIALQYNFLDSFQLQAIVEAVRKTQRSRVVNAPRITIFNGQRSHVLNISQRAYIQDVEVNQTGVIPVLNPVIGILNSGAILEVRPTVSHDRRYVTMEVKPTLATELPARLPAPVTLAGGFTSIPIELPVLTIQKMRATVTVPDGGTVLLGGLKNYDEFEGVSGVPFLMRIPILNNLFRRQAFHQLRASLVVLLRADITVIRDEERDLFGTD
jgi:tetratricopeptide (TPR) repeat protein